MLITHEREKLFNAIIYFLENTSWYGITKLFKLLYFLDFDHYKETGRSVTGMDYFAWKMGPVPSALREEIDQPKDDLLETFDIEIQLTREGKKKEKGKTIYLKPKSHFDPKYFTKRELRLLEDIANRYSLSTAREMVELTHLKTQPWHQVWEVEKNHFHEIPYDYVLSEDEKELILPLAIEHQEMIKNYQ